MCIRDREWWRLARVDRATILAARHLPGTYTLWAKAITYCQAIERCQPPKSINANQGQGLADLYWSAAILVQQSNGQRRDCLLHIVMPKYAWSATRKSCSHQGGKTRWCCANL